LQAPFIFLQYMTNLSVNINKPALLRNSRGSDLPKLVQIAKDCERFGADGITIHPRPDERHVKYADAYELKDEVSTEFNIEGNPTEKFLKMVLEVKPHQCTLVPDDPNQLTSDHGWDTIKHKAHLTEVTAELKSNGIRVSLFIDPLEQFIEGAKAVDADRIEYYTGPFAEIYKTNPKNAIEDYKNTAKLANNIGLGINAGHDLNLENLKFFAQEIPNLLEVSIGHALFCDAIYLGLENTINMYKRLLK